MNKRVVITGLGVISPVGNTVDAYWDSLTSGKSGVGPVTRFDISDFTAKIAAEVKDFDVTEYVEKKASRRMDLSEQYAIAASDQAVKDSKLDLESVDLERCGVVVGSGM